MYRKGSNSSSGYFDFGDCSYSSFNVTPEIEMKGKKMTGKPKEETLWFKLCWLNLIIWGGFGEAPGNQKNITNY